MELDERTKKQDRAVLVGLNADCFTKEQTATDETLEELEALLETAGGFCTAKVLQNRHAPDAHSFIGEGKAQEVRMLAEATESTMVIFDNELSPGNIRALEEIIGVPVLDRSALILDIFAQRAKTREGRLQVELAQNKYLLPRLSGMGTSLSRQGGGIGTRGPGETKLETDRRRIRDRMTRIRKELDDLRRQRANTRARRERQGLPVAALVGYTNAGKSTLLNALTRSDVLSENKLFATLDPTTRRLRFPKERELVLADTVGFIRNLPKELVEAFRATLEELESADILLHVTDASHPEFDRQMESVESILADLELSGIPRLLVLNKWDAADEDTRAALLATFPDALPVSALTGAGLDRFSRELEKRLFGEEETGQERCCDAEA